MFPDWYDCAAVTDKRSICACVSPDSSLLNDRVVTVCKLGSTTETVVFCVSAGKSSFVLSNPCKPLIRPANSNHLPPCVPKTKDCRPLGNEKPACSIWMLNGTLLLERIGLTLVV